MEDLIRRGATVVFATSFRHRDAAEEVARRHPDVIVLHQGGVKTDAALANFGTYWGTVYELVYQLGITAGAASKTDQLGFVAAFPIPATFANVNAFTLGARTVNPAVTTRVVFTDAWCDPERQAEAARELLAARVDVLAQHQDCTRTILEAAERSGIHAVGYHYDASEVAPRSWLAGAVWDWRDLYVDATRKALGGQFDDSPYDGDFRGRLETGDNPFILTEFGPDVAPQTQRAVREAGAWFADGGTPFQGPLMDRSGRLRVPTGRSLSVAEIEAMDYFVPGVVGDAPGD
jgi:simple sugar transport system substrate-binding protein/basic membrane protein A